MDPDERAGPRPRRDRRERREMRGERERTRDLGEKKKRGPEARPTAGGFGQAYIGGFDSAGPAREEKQQEKERQRSRMEKKKEEKMRERRKERSLFDRRSAGCSTAGAPLALS